jgi:O-antigen/teichoic acid export membrane protein
MAGRAGSALVWKGIQLSATKLIYVARLLILARLLSPDDFGLFAIAAIVTGVLLTLSDLGIAPALIQKEHPQQQDYLAAWNLEILRALAIAAILFCMAPLIAGLFGDLRAVAIIQVLALRPLLMALASNQLARLNRNLEFRTMAALKIPAALIDLTVAVCLANSLGVWALVAGIFAGEAVTVILANLLRPWKPAFALRLEDIRPLINYGRWIFLTGLVALAGSTILQLVVAQKLGAAELGLFYLALQITRLPSDVTDQVFNPVAFPLYSRLKANKQRIRHAFRTIFVGMSGILVPAYALLIALAPSLTTNILGPEWTGAAPLIQVLAIAGLISALSDAVAPLLNGTGQPNKVAVIEAAQSIPIIFLVWQLADVYGAVGAASALIPAMLLSQVVSGLFLRQTVDGQLWYLLPPVAAIIVAAAAGATLAFSLDGAIQGAPGLALAAIVGTMLILAILLICDRRFAFGIVDDIFHAFPRLKAISAQRRNSRD